MSVRIEDIRYIPQPKINSYALVGWLPRLNVRRDYGTEREMREARDMLVPLGWDAQYPAIAEIATEAEIVELIEKRKKDHEFLKSVIDEKDLPSVPIVEGGKNVNIDGREYMLAKLAMFEYLYLNKSGSYIKPMAIGTTGNRRGSVLLDSSTVQLIIARRNHNDNKLQPSDVEESITTQIAILVPDTPSKRFPDVAVRKQAQLRENETKTTGFKKMTDTERLEATLDLVENHGKSQSDIRNSGYGATLGLRLYFACVIDVYCRSKVNDHTLTKEERKEWSDVRLGERLMAPQFLTDEDRQKSKSNPNWIDFAKFQQKAFQGDKENTPMGNMCETESKFEKENRRRESLKTPQSPLVRPSAEMVQSWMSTIVEEGTARVAPQLKREAISNLSERAKNPFIKDAMKAVDKNDESFLAMANARAGVAMYLYGISQAGYEQMAIACAALADLSDEEQLAHWTKFVESVMVAVTVADPVS